MIWPNERAYDKIIDGMALGYAVPAPLIKGIIAKESSFNPHAKKPEPQINDMSRGLMQVLLRTARGLGFTGPEAELFKPSLNIRLGTQLLHENLQSTNGNVDQAVAAYNAGWRWFINKQPIPNQAYVDDVKVYTAYFAGRITEQETRDYIRSKKTGSPVLPGGATSFFSCC